MKEGKIDLLKLHRAEYKAGQKPGLVETSRAMYLSVEGRGKPGSEDFSAAITALYAMAYTIKMGRKAKGKGDYTIGKLEGLYWTEDGSKLDTTPMEKWCWKLMIRTPETVGKFPITHKDLETARQRLLERKKATGTEKVKIHYLTEGSHVQMLHVGPYDQQQETVDLMLKYCGDNDLKVFGAHHEIYLSDPRRVKPENLKTILRLQIRRLCL